MGDLPRIKKSKLDCWDTREEVSLRKLAQTAFDSVSLDSLTDTDIAAPDNNDGLFYNLSLDQWENDSFKTVNGQTLRGTGDITITTSGALSGLSDVTITTPLNNQVLTYNGSLSRWENQAVPAPSLSLDGLTDVSIVSPTSNQALAWDAVALEWINTDGSKIVPAAGGTNEIQYNNGSDEFAANSNFTFNPSTQTLTVDNIRSNQYLNTGTATTIFGTGNANPVLLTAEFSGTVGVANLSVPASDGSTLREFKLQSNWSEPRFFDGTADRNVLHAGNIKTVGGESILGSGDISVGGTPAASAVTYDNTTSGLTATNVQAAIDEIAVDIAALTPENIFADSRWQYTDFSTNVVSTLNIWTASNSFVSGSSAVSFEPGFGGVWEVTGGSSAGAGYRFVPPNFSLSIFSGLSYRCIFKTASIAANKGAFLGFVNATQAGSLPANGLLLDYDAASQNATFTARDASVSTTAATSYAMLADTWYICDIVVAASSARCVLRLINGTVVYDETISSGIPYNDVTKIVVPGAAFINRSLASAQIGKIDYIGYGVTKPSWMVLP